MKYFLSGDSLADASADAVVGFVFEEPNSAAAELWDALTGGLAGELFARGEFKGKLYSTARIHRPAGMQAGQLLLIGCGPQEKFSSVLLRECAGVAGRALRASGVRSAAIQARGEDAVRAVVEGFSAALYEPDCYKTGGERSSPTLESATVLAPSAQRGALERAVAAAEGQRFARELANEPGNILPPRVLAERASAMAAQAGLACEILDEGRIRELKMGALLGVAQGSAEPPAIVVLRYRPRGTQDAGGVHLGLVGKAVTFDTGGISIKPSAEMDRMKYDMAGGAAVIGAMQAIAALRPPAPVTAVIPSVENMPGGGAQRPGDVVTTMSGKTVEVLNTDAEGRLILADALTYAQRQGCTHLVDAATAYGRGGGRLGLRELGSLHERRRLAGAPAAGGCRRGRKDVADASGRCLRGAARKPHRRHGQRRAALGGSGHGGGLPEAFRRSASLGSSRHRRHRVVRGTETVRGEGPERRRRAHACRVGAQRRAAILSRAGSAWKKRLSLTADDS